MKYVIKITATGHSSGGKGEKKTNCGVSTLILLVREAAPVQYVLEITVYLEQLQVERNTVKRHRNRRSEKADLFTSNTVQRNKKREATVTAWLLLAVFLVFLFWFFFYILIF